MSVFWAISLSCLFLPRSSQPLLQMDVGQIFWYHSERRSLTSLLSAPTFLVLPCSQAQPAVFVLNKWNNPFNSELIHFWRTQFISSWDSIYVNWRPCAQGEVPEGPFTMLITTSAGSQVLLGLGGGGHTPGKEEIKQKGSKMNKMKTKIWWKRC